MSESDPDAVTQLLAQATAGDTAAYNELLELLFGELRDIAERHMRHERANHTLQPTALVHEAYMRLADLDRMTWQDKAHFLSLASRVMRQHLIDHARGKGTDKRGGDWTRVDLGGDLSDDDALRHDAVDLERLELAMEHLRSLSPRQEQIAQLKYFAGMTNKHVAHVLGVSERTVVAEWKMARMTLQEAYDADRPSS